MIEKSTAIILHQVKFTDTGVIVQAFTGRFGRLSLLIKGVRNRKAGKHNVYLQPLSIIEVVFYYRQTRSVQSVKEFSVAYAPGDIHVNIIKSSMAIFLSEFLNSVLREETPQEELFGFIKDSIMYFDSRKEGYSNFHIAFLCALCSYIGIEPGQRMNEEDIFFDLLNGKFMPLRPSHSLFLEKNTSEILALFFNTSWDDMNKIPLTGAARNDVLEALVKYYSTHLPGLKKIKSIDILREVFS
ncbi:MAG: DNA repair protein RecO [Bacteroidales bacterium]